MKRLLPQFQNIKIWQSFLLAMFSVLLAWIATTYAVIDYARNSGYYIPDMGGLSRIALTTFELKVIIYGLVIYCLAGLFCLVIFSILKNLRRYPVAQSIWALLIVFGISVSYALK